MPIIDLYNSALEFADTSKPALPGRICPCLLCGKPFIMRVYIGEPDQICSECWTIYKDCAKLVCTKCRVTICRVRPKVLDNGFYIKPKSVLHTNACNVCKPGLTVSDIVEIKEWERQVKPKKIIIAKR